MIAPRLRNAADFILSPSPERLEALAPAWMVRRPRVGVLLIASLILAAYCLLVNPYWHFTVDSALYLTLARNLIEGRGYTFNGVPHCQVPGGWAYALSLLLRVSHSFFWLNVVQTLIMLAGLGVLYLALRQMLAAGGAAVIVLLTAFSIWVYEYAMGLMSEAPFFLCSNMAVLFLLKATRSDSRRARVVFSVGLCAALTAAFIFRLVACFWIGPFAVALLLENRAGRRLPGRLASAAGVCLVLVGCYVAYRHWGAAVAHQLARAPLEPTAARILKAGAGSYTVPPLSRDRLLFRLGSLVFWPSWLLWPPSGMLQQMSVKHVAWLIAWIPNLVVALGCYRAARRGQIFLAASLLFFAPFLLWSSGGAPTTGRYAIAIVPFLPILFLLGLQHVGEVLRDRAHLPVRPALLVALGAGSILLPGLLFFSVDVYVQRSPDYYAVFRGGGYAGMMGNLRWLREHEVVEPVACRNHATLRAVACLTGYRVARMDKGVVPVAPGFEEEAGRFATETGVRYLMTMDKHRRDRWPLWHIPRELLGGESLPADFWQLWRYEPAGDELIRIPVEPLYRWPTELPPGRPEKP